MAERVTGARALLELPVVYSGMHRLLACAGHREEIVRCYVRPRPGDRIIDIGCGPADFRGALGEVDYLGIDRNPGNIARARRRWRGRGRFLHGDVAEIAALQPAAFDLALATGVLHHLDDDQARDLFARARRLLRAGGRMITTDPAFTAGQSPIARFLIRNDRGANIRQPGALAALAAGHFASVTCHIRTDLMRIPYTHAILECAT
jgi:SAM-dependent methyltransferase